MVLVVPYTENNGPSTYACAPWIRTYGHDDIKGGLGKAPTCLLCVAALTR